MAARLVSIENGASTDTLLRRLRAEDFGGSLARLSRVRVVWFVGCLRPYPRPQAQSEIIGSVANANSLARSPWSNIARTRMNSGVE
jgi:hypothetical protein